MITYIVLQDVVTFRADWKRLVDPNAYSVVLLASLRARAGLDPQQAECFASIVEVDPFDRENIIEVVRSMQLKEGAVRLVSNDEYSLRVMGEVGAELGIAGLRGSTYLPFTDKVEMKKRVAVHGLPVPAHRPFDPDEYARQPDRYVAETVAVLKLPIFAKPVDSAGSENTAKLSSEAEVDAWARAHATARNFELDEYVTSGRLFHCDSIVVGRRVLHCEACEYSHPNAEFLNGRPLGSIQISRDSELYAKALAYNQRVLSAFDELPDGATHLEFFLWHDEFVFLEIAARAPGGMVPQMHEKNMGMNYEELHFRSQMGLLDTVTTRRAAHCAWMWHPRHEGVVANRIDPPLVSDFLIDWHVEPGEHMCDPTSIRDRACSILFWSDDFETLQADFAMLRSDYQPVVLE